MPPEFKGRYALKAAFAPESQGSSADFSSSHELTETSRFSITGLVSSATPGLPASMRRAAAMSLLRRGPCASISSHFCAMSPAMIKPYDLMFSNWRSMSRSLDLSSWMTS